MRRARDRVQPLQQRREVARGIVGRLVVVDDLPEQLHFPRPGPRRAGIREDVRTGRIRS
jgi:hypothetical protein